MQTVVVNKCNAVEESQQLACISAKAIPLVLFHKDDDQLKVSDIAANLL